jgi:hypothetical protein
MAKDEKPEQSNDKRKRYEKPRVVFREPLEAVASSCTTSPGKSSPAESCSFASS